MQDFGMICLCLKKFPNLEIHASTQAHNVSKEGIDFLYKLGVKRVVLPREMSLEEIKQIILCQPKDDCNRFKYGQHHNRQPVFFHPAAP